MAFLYREFILINADFSIYSPKDLYWLIYQQSKLMAGVRLGFFLFSVFYFGLIFVVVFFIVKL